jgi:hypothetical protein
MDKLSKIYITIGLRLTAAFMILSSTVFNDKSRFCLISEKSKMLNKVLDTNKDNLVSDIEIYKAHDILCKANLQSSN